MKKTNVLAVFANPKGSDPIRLGNEDRAMRESIRLSQYRKRVDLEILHATRVDDFARALLEKEYRIVHFSGHGTGNGLAFENESGQVQVVPKEALTETLSAYSPPIECVLLNACYSGIHATSLSTGVPYAIVMNGPISDEGATEFTRGFYDAIGAGKAVEFAYQEGRRRIKLKGLPDGATPVLESFGLKILRVLSRPGSGGRTGNGIRADTGLDTATVTNRLDILKKDGYVSVERTNGERWSITALGRKLLEDTGHVTSDLSQ